MKSFRLHVGEKKYLTGAGWASLLLAALLTGFIGYAAAIWLADTIGPGWPMIWLVAGSGIVTWGLSWLAFHAAGFPLIADSDDPADRLPSEN